jgi:hypothetical protein
MYRIVERRQNNVNPDERLNREEEQKKVKKWRNLQKVKNCGAHNTRSQTLHIMYLT